MYNLIVIADIICYYIYVIEIILKSDVIINAEGGYVNETFNKAEKEAIQRYRHVFIINFRRERIFVKSERRIGNLMKVSIKFTSNHFK